MSKTARVQLALPADWLDAFRSAADRRGLSLSAWIREQAASRLPAPVRKQLSEPKKPGPVAAATKPASTD